MIRFKYNRFLKKLLKTHSHELIAEISPTGIYSVKCTFPGCDFNQGGAIDMKLVKKAKIICLDNYYVCPFICWLGEKGPLQCSAYGSYCQIELRHVLPLWETPCLRNGHICFEYSDAEDCPFHRAKLLSNVYGQLHMQYPSGFPSPKSKLLNNFLTWAKTKRHGWPKEPLQKCRW